MGEIKVFGKWDLEKGVWIQKPDPKFFGRSFAIANYENIINDPEYNIDNEMVYPKCFVVYKLAKDGYIDYSSETYQKYNCLLKTDNN